MIGIDLKLGAPGAASTIPASRLAKVPNQHLLVTEISFLSDRAEPSPMGPKP